MAGFAVLGGILGFTLASYNIVGLAEPLSSLIPKDRRVLFLTNLWAHSASYLGGIIGAIVLIVWAWLKRAKFRTGHRRGN